MRETERPTAKSTSNIQKVHTVTTNSMTLDSLLRSSESIRTMRSVQLEFVKSSRGNKGDLTTWHIRNGV